MNVKITGDGDSRPAEVLRSARAAPQWRRRGITPPARIEVGWPALLLAWRGRTSRSPWAPTAASTPELPAAYVGASDGYQDLAAEYEDGLAASAGARRQHRHDGRDRRRLHREFTVAIALGDGHHAALANMMQTPRQPFEIHRQALHPAVAARRRRPRKSICRRPPTTARLARISHNVILTHEDKTYSGAFIASASIPWGASKGDADLGGYHLVWTTRHDSVRDRSAGLRSTRRPPFARWSIWPAPSGTDGSFAQNFWIDGTPYWTGIQLDEVAFPIILAWRLWKVNGLGSFDVLPFVERAASFLVRYAPLPSRSDGRRTPATPPPRSPPSSPAWCALRTSRALSERGSRSSPVTSRPMPTGSRPSRRVDDHRPKAFSIPTSSTTTCASGRRRPASRFTTPQIPPGLRIRIANRGPGREGRV